ncbi:hypothetical protein K7C98_31735 [Nannocystis pusilla]|uniref:Uncharacterized protein n=1 Tax=Nannocystis pusilla TaxID=889268 RepID=A0ABS7U049_9BACT|nr:hypothetical protein [Nannocystis pusilla]
MRASTIRAPPRGRQAASVHRRELTLELRRELVARPLGLAHARALRARGDSPVR